jgi:hypothetical protein
VILHEEHLMRAKRADHETVTTDIAADPF